MSYKRLKPEKNVKQMHRVLFYCSYDVFFAMSHGVHRGILKKGKIDAREHFINKLITIPPNIKFDCYGLNEVQPIWSEDFINSISQNKIGLNLSQGKPSNFYSSHYYMLLTFQEMDQHNLACNI